MQSNSSSLHGPNLCILSSFDDSNKRSFGMMVCFVPMFVSWHDLSHPKELPSMDVLAIKNLQIQSIPFGFVVQGAKKFIRMCRILGLGDPAVLSVCVRYVPYIENITVLKPSMKLVDYFTQANPDQEVFSAGYTVGLFHCRSGQDRNSDHRLLSLHINSWPD